MTIFIINLTYTCDLSEIDTHKAAHIEYLKEHYDAGHFLMSGPQVPRKGGVIIARHHSREEVENVLQQDPFAQHNLAEYEVVEIDPTMWADEVSPLMDFWEIK